ncbi:hypothetical protein BGX26_007887 [Mortierella sp. AD094]|nr:hypothetical protein BGX26_007887 [Mortierella sp. AD094]
MTALPINVVRLSDRVMKVLEDWIAGNGVIHVVNKVLMPPRIEGCERMTAEECTAREIMWDLGDVGLESVVDDVPEWWDGLTLFDMEDIFMEDDMFWRLEDDLSDVQE